jgi:hypothetical protein
VTLIPISEEKWGKRTGKMHAFIFFKEINYYPFVTVGQLKEIHRATFPTLETNINISEILTALQRLCRILTRFWSKKSGFLYIFAIWTFVGAETVDFKIALVFSILDSLKYHTIPVGKQSQ